MAYMIFVSYIIIVLMVWMFSSFYAAFLTMIIIPAVILALGFYLKNKREAATKSLLQNVDYSWASVFSSIAITKTDGMVALSKGRVYKTYSFDQVRKWRREQHEADKFVGIGYSGSIAALQANMDAAERAGKVSGFFLEVKDIDYPEWRIDMPEKQQKKWFEVFNQYLNEAV